MGKHFNFEVAFGIGYGWEFQKFTYSNGETHRNTASGIAFNTRVAFGYMF